ncbi:stress response protein nst1 [Raoultibacter phocaeensis]|uniref:stress response protein nst1 n=1 Tax=Raoultibacter phocaeensis TaxID=2479841 RepID=UPI00111A21B7|nr:stress response protein nst1 [Raoultibacter phocaeensis]
MRPYYEGWYLKQQQGDEFLAVIPGRAEDGAFVQIVTQDEAHYVEYPLESYSKTASTTCAADRIPGGDFANGSMRVGASTFAPDGMTLSIDTPKLEVSGTLLYRDRTPLRSDIMGPFAILPMETKHVVHSMRHRVEGTVLLNGRPLVFDGGAGYMEGDRGHSFPRTYTWAQSVDFDSNASVVLAVAEIPLGIRFTGCFAVISLDNVEHRLATYLGARVSHRDERTVELTQRDLRLRIEHLGPSGHALRAPSSGEMRRTIHESPASAARFLLTKGEDVLLDAVCDHASYEYVG